MNEEISVDTGCTMKRKESIFSSVQGIISDHYRPLFKDSLRNELITEMVAMAGVNLYKIADSSGDIFQVEGSLEQVVGLVTLVRALPDVAFNHQINDEELAACREFIGKVRSKSNSDDDDGLEEGELHALDSQMDSLVKDTVESVGQADRIVQDEAVKLEREKLDEEEAPVNLGRVTEISEDLVKALGFNEARGLDRKSQIYEHLGENKFMCGRCSFKTKRQSHMEKHLKMHQEENVVIYKCPQTDCDYKCIRNGDIKKHTIAAHSDPNKLLSCNICNYKTMEEKLLHRHKKYSHKENDIESKQLLYECNDCEYKTMKILFFARHMKRHGIATSKLDGTAKACYNKGDIQPMLACKLCGYKAKKRSHLKRHHSSVHLQARTFLCQVCGIGFKRSDALKQHAVVHTDSDNIITSIPDKIECPECNKIVRSQTALKEHLAVHENSKSFKCEHCKRGFNTASILQKHIKTIHATPRAWACPLCKKRFNTQFTMKRHSKTHALSKTEKNVGDDSEVKKEKSSKSDDNSSGNSLVDVAGGATLTYLMDDQGELIITSSLNNQHLPNVIPIQFIMEEQPDA